VYNDCEMIKLTAPYIPGFLGFREVPFIKQLFEKQVHDRPDLTPHCVIVDGNGILHPKGAWMQCLTMALGYGY